MKTMFIGVILVAVIIMIILLTLNLIFSLDEEKTVNEFDADKIPIGFTDTLESEMKDIASVNETKMIDSENDDWKKIIFPELYDDEGNRLPEYDDSVLKVYVQNIPEYSHDSITMKTVEDALDSWEEVNSIVKFMRVDKSQDSDIDIKWVTKINFPTHVMGITESETTEYLDSGLVSYNHEILIDLADTDCNGNPVFWNKESITDTIKHELGHALGIIQHSSNENHLMYDPDDGVKNILTHGLVVPERITAPYYIGEKVIRDKTEELDAKFVKTLGYYGWSVDDWEYDRKSSNDESFYNRVNSIIDEMNPIIEKSNCFAESTNAYDPYG